VSANAKPTSDSDIKIEVWLPVSGWNNKLLGLGNGGFAGLIDYLNLATAISKGYAATATDAGHTGSPLDAAWAAGHPEKVVDFGTLEKSAGLGLSLTRDRIAGLYPNASSRVEVRHRAEGGTEVEIALPWTAADEEVGDARCPSSTASASLMPLVPRRCR
jgi:hypothetical protein